MLKDSLKGGNRFLPIRAARLRQPLAAFGLKKYLRGTFPVSITPDNVDSTTRLGDSEVFAIKHTPSDAIPEFGQRPEYNSEISPFVRAKKTRDVLEHKNSGACFSNESSKLKKEARLFSSEPVAFSHSCKRDVLAREAGDPNIRGWDFCTAHLLDVGALRN
jgi:hypothetical protein